jgi:hypothetical protein|tara:strand:- start:3380 stop:3562 length:183 start_codon:yes stop_codon:yes gene_type:complete
MKNSTTDRNLTPEQAAWVAEGNVITICRPYNKRPEPRRFPYSIANRGAKRINLQNAGITR